MVYSAEHAELELRLVLSVKPEANCLLCVLTGSAFYLCLSVSLSLSLKRDIKVHRSRFKPHNVDELKCP